MRSAVVQTCVELAREGVDIHFMTADLGFKVLDPFREAAPKRFTNVGVAEANMVSLAAGLALTGKRPLCYSMVPFLLFRGFEQVRLDVVAAGLPIVLVGVGGGLSYGHEGMSHHAIEDLAIARALPGLRVLCPGDPLEAAAAVRLAFASEGPTYIRVGQNNDARIHKASVEALSQPLCIRDGGPRIVMLVTGHILATAVEAAQGLAEEGIEVSLFSVPMVKPIAIEFLRTLARTVEAIVTVEEHSVVGGLGSAVAETLLEERFARRFLKVGLPDAYCTTHGTPKWLRSYYGIDAEGIADRVRELVA